MFPKQLSAKLSKVQLLAVDVDGVLTDGTLYYGPRGETLKTFHVRDGMGIRMLMDSGVQLAVITGRQCEALDRRLSDLGVRHYYPGCKDKLRALEDLIAATAIPASQMAFLGDDIPDLSVMSQVGVAIAVRDAHVMVREQAHWTTELRGGRGVVREVTDAILTSRGKWEGACSNAVSGSVASPFSVVIPSRYASTRLPGKPLCLIAGRPLVAHVWDRAIESGAANVVVATDDQRIAKVVKEVGGNAIMTSSQHTSGTERLTEVAQLLDWDDAEVVVNLQGDEPCVPGPLIRKLATALVNESRAQIATVATPIRTAQELFDPNVVKVVLDHRHMANYFSRAPIPWHRDGFSLISPDSLNLPPGATFLRHIGLYAYRVGTLKRLAQSSPTAYEQLEALEQLRALHMGMNIHVSVVEEPPGHGVDTEQDLHRVQQLLSGSTA